MDKIPERTDEKQIIVDARSINKKRISTNAFLSSVAATLLVIITLIYLAEIDPGIKISWQYLTVNGVLILLATQAFHMIMKTIAREKKRSNEKYSEIQKSAKEAIERLGKSEYSSRINEYCAQHTEETTERVKSAILAPSGISYSEYLEKYIGKNAKEISEAFPGKHLTKNQVRAVLQCNRVKIEPYDPNFLREFLPEAQENVEPSRRYRPQHDDKMETVRNIISGSILCLFVVNIGGSIFLNWSAAAVIACLVKLTATIISGVNGYIFGGKNGDTEIALMRTKAVEADACIEWCKRNPSPAQSIGDSKQLPQGGITLFKGTGE